MSKLSKIAHAVGHGVWIGAQYANYASGVVPPKYQPIAAATIGLVQAIHGYYVGKQVHNG